MTFVPKVDNMLAPITATQTIPAVTQTIELTL
ncbi:hypothetical protein OKW12_004301 [Pseudomonas silensiensis]|uniref:Uncharacterized protein n=1 Tax=Pseudomonas mandelii TaxID=75612 RepID=A0ABY0VET3_9PSED|nr:hypothetical protein [Pseudomonas silensiensis]SDU15126.1 hypothetical protein SAMN04489801_1161 [Pseudomonas mandelii]